MLISLFCGVQLLKTNSSHIEKTPDESMLFDKQDRDAEILKVGWYAWDCLPQLGHIY
jgi:hypothetical protein